MNYHLTNIGNTTIPDMSHDELLQKYAEHFQQQDFEKVFDRVRAFREEGKYRNWYESISKVPIDVIQVVTSLKSLRLRKLLD